MRAVLMILAASLAITAGADEFPGVYNSDADKDATPLSAVEAAKSMRVPEGFRVQLFASEPEVQNPIGVCWDDRNRLWVAENYTYAERQQRFDLSLRDRVIILEDRDHDGRAESRKVFYDQLQMLTSVEFGRGGVWLMCPPQLLFIPDANRDDVPDGPVQVILDGFTVARDNYHNYANGLRWGPDGWLYGRCGHSCPGWLGPPGTPEDERVPIDGGIWRYHCESQRVEVLCHGTTNPWGHDWDSNGELFFINTVIGHLWHSVPGAHFKESFGESMNGRVYERMDMIADHYHFDKRVNWSDSRDGNANDFGGGHAHIGAMIYQHGHWPKEFQNRLFTMNMHGYRANVERIERDGAGYTARHEPDFLFAKDPFFRSVEILQSPDGNAMVVDWSDTNECHEHNGVHRTSGRLFKVSFGEANAPGKFAKPVCMLGSGPLPQLWRDYQQGRTNSTTLRQLLSSDDEHVRVWAIRLLTDFWPLDTILGPRKNAKYVDDPETRARFVELAANDPSGLVLLTLASTLQRLPHELRAELALRLVAREEFANDRDLPKLVWFGLIPLADTKPSALVSIAQACQLPATLTYISRALMSQIEEDSEPVSELVSRASQFPELRQDAVLIGMQQAVQGWRKCPTPQGWDEFANMTSKRHPETVRALSSVFGDGRALAEIREIVKSSDLELATRQSALKTLIDADVDDLQEICESVLEVRELNIIAAQGLIQFDTPAVARKLVKSYRRFHPTDRPALIEALLSRPSFVRALLDNVGTNGGQIPPADISPYHAQRILTLGDTDLRERLRRVWGELRESPADRQRQIAEYRQSLTPEILAKADLPAGRALFKQSCAACHVLFGDGGKIGPELTGSQRSNLDYLLVNIIDPSSVVGKDYGMTQVVTRDGRIIGGLLVSRDDKRIVLQTPTEQQTIAAEDIQESRQTTLSPMPEGMLDRLSTDQRRDLVGYLMHPVQVPLTAPSGEPSPNQ